jgi:hypothetical protein
MEFDFSKVAKDLQVIRESVHKKEESLIKPEPKIIGVDFDTPEVVTVPVETTPKEKKLSVDETVDLLIEELKGTPKVMFSDRRVTTLYDASTEEITVVRRSDNYSPVMAQAKAFYEDVVFNSTTLADRASKVHKMIRDLFGPILDEKIEEPIVVPVEETIEEIKTPEDVFEMAIPEF